MNLRPETIAKIDQLVPRYPEKRSATLPLLHIIQEEQGYISDAAIEWVAGRLELQPINVLEVVTFYPMLRRQPVGRHHIKVCRTLSCALAGADKICQTFQKEFGVGLDETTADGRATIEYVECIASCGTGPVVQINEDLLENLTEEKAREIAAGLKAE